MKQEYSWNSILAIHQYFSKSLIDIHYLRKIWNSNIDPDSVYLPDCFSLYRKITGNFFDLKLLNDEERNCDIKYLFLRSLFLEDLFAIRQLSNVEVIDCEVQNIVDSLVPLKNLKKLKELYFSGNKINNLEPLSELKQLEVLDLSDNRLTYIKELYGLVNLKRLYLDANKIYDISFLSNLTSLEELDISRNEISDIKSLCGLKTLKVLRLSYNHLCDEKIIELGKQIRSCKIYFESQSLEPGYLLLKEIDYTDVPFFVSHICNPNVEHCRVYLLDDRFKSKRNIIDEMKTICREVVNSAQRKSLIIRDFKREHFFEESSGFVRAQFDY